jgi:uncharacterized membrane protein
MGNGDTTRLEMFSDGVFAIAITLLVLEIRVPHVGEGESLVVALLGLWPSYLGYAVSFLQIGVIWANHHNRFRLLERSDHVLLFLNILFLLCVAFIPFPTALLAEYKGRRESARRRSRSTAALWPLPVSSLPSSGSTRPTITGW